MMDHRAIDGPIDPRRDARTGRAATEAGAARARPRADGRTTRHKYYTILSTIPYHIIPYHTTLYYTMLYYTILYYTILYYTILY